MIKKRKLTYQQAAIVGQKAIKKAFQDALKNGAQWLAAEQESELCKEVAKVDDVYIFELSFYPVDAHPDSKNPFVVARVKVDSVTGEVVNKPEVYLPPVLASEIPEIN